MHVRNLSLSLPTLPPTAWRRAVNGVSASVVCVLTALLPATFLAAAEPGDKLHPAADTELTSYKSTVASGTVEALHVRMERSEARLEFSPPHGYLPANLIKQAQTFGQRKLLIAEQIRPVFLINA